jgi:hypothetical protein
MVLRPSSADPQYGQVAADYGRFRLRRVFMPLEGGGAVPTTQIAFLLVRETGIEAEVTWIPRFLATLPGIMWHIEQWLESELARLRARVAEREARRQRLAAGEEPFEWTAERPQAQRREQQRQRWQDDLERFYQEHFGDWRPPQPTREEALQYLQQMAPGEEPCLDLTVVRTPAMSLEEKHQHYHKVTAAWHELRAAYPGVVPHRDNPLRAPKKPQ